MHNPGAFKTLWTEANSAICLAVMKGDKGRGNQYLLSTGCSRNYVTCFTLVISFSSSRQSLLLIPFHKWLRSICCDSWEWVGVMGKHLMNWSSKMVYFQICGWECDVQLGKGPVWWPMTENCPPCTLFLNSSSLFNFQILFVSMPQDPILLSKS